MFLCATVLLIKIRDPLDAPTSRVVECNIEHANDWGYRGEGRKIRRQTAQKIRRPFTTCSLWYPYACCSRCWAGSFPGNVYQLFPFWNKGKREKEEKKPPPFVRLFNCISITSGRRWLNMPVQNAYAMVCNRLNMLIWINCAVYVYAAPGCMLWLGQVSLVYHEREPWNFARCGYMNGKRFGNAARFVGAAISIWNWLVQP